MAVNQRENMQSNMQDAKAKYQIIFKTFFNLISLIFEKKKKTRFI